MDIEKQLTVENKMKALKCGYTEELENCWFEKKTSNEVLKQLQLNRELFKTICKRQMKFFFFWPYKKAQQYFERYFRGTNSR
jgi:hypothetical protein